MQTRCGLNCRTREESANNVPAQCFMTKPLLLSARTAMWSMPVVLTETENENDSANQNYVAKMTLQKWHCKKKRALATLLADDITSTNNPLIFNCKSTIQCAWLYHVSNDRHLWVINIFESEGLSSRQAVGRNTFSQEISCTLTTAPDF